MEYKVYRFEFKTGVHFGKRSLDDTEFTLCADTLFSAMCQEYLKKDSGRMEQFVQKASAGKIRISDAFPYIGDTLYLPKPMLKIQAEENKGDSTLKKAYKKLNYVPAQRMEQYLEGRLDVKQEGNLFREGLGKKEVKVSAAVRGEKETRPYRVGTYYFNPGSGLYVILGYEDEKDVWEVEKCLAAVGLSGIGGKRHAGLGRFEIKPGELPEDVTARFQTEHAAVCMSLSLSLPREEEMEIALQNASYLLLKRSGFVQSDTYADEQSRKRDLYVLQAGSCFQNKFEGDVYDVSDGGSHPVYRYAKPLFWEVIS